jgi:hypothetical protein
VGVIGIESHIETWHAIKGACVVVDKLHFGIGREVWCS